MFWLPAFHTVVMHLFPQVCLEGSQFYSVKAYLLLAVCPWNTFSFNPVYSRCQCLHGMQTIMWRICTVAGWLLRTLRTACEWVKSPKLCHIVLLHVDCCCSIISCVNYGIYLYKNVRITLDGGASGVAAYNDAAGLPQHGYIAQWLPASVQPQPCRWVTWSSSLTVSYSVTARAGPMFIARGANAPANAQAVSGHGVRPLDQYSAVVGFVARS